MISTNPKEKTEAKGRCQSKTNLGDEPNDLVAGSIRIAIPVAVSRNPGLDANGRWDAVGLRVVLRPHRGEGGKVAEHASHCSTVFDRKDPAQ